MFYYWQKFKLADFDSHCDHHNAFKVDINDDNKIFLPAQFLW